MLRQLSLSLGDYDFDAGGRVLFVVVFWPLREILRVECSHFSLMVPLAAHSLHRPNSFTGLGASTVSAIGLFAFRTCPVEKVVVS